MSSWRRLGRSRFARFRSRSRGAGRIPTESMADIAFLLIVFYMSSAILRPETGLDVDLPRARNTLRQPPERVAHIWIDADGRPWVNDLYVQYDQIAPILVAKLRANPQLIVALHCDRRTRYTYMDRALAELKKAEAVRVSFTAIPNPAGP